MRKGDESKRKIVEAAERLFNQKGYEATSVQDILDLLGISKGGFYHYFSTKMELLVEVCRRRAEEWYSHGVAYVRSLRAGSVEKLNVALKLMNLLDRERGAMLGAITELGMHGEDASVTFHLREITMRMLCPLLEEILEAGLREKQFVVRRPAETARLLTMLAMDVNEAAVKDVAAGFRSPECAGNVLELLETYRRAAEQLVNAPYGSLELFDGADMIATISRIAAGLAVREAEGL